MIDPEVKPPVSAPAFIKGLLASLALRGTTHVVTLNNDHQNRFRKTVEFLNNTARTNPGLCERLPIFAPSPVTGEYDEFDEALITFQGLGLTRCIGPYFHEVEVDIAPLRAKRILDRLTESEQELLGKLASTFIEAR